jgi:putative acetyltransferase
LIAVRREMPSDISAVRIVNQRAFGQPLEASLVDALRGIEGVISLVATIDAQVVGHILFSPVKIDNAGTDISAMGLAPMAVLPEFQRRGIGSALIAAGLDTCRKENHDLVVVLGHSDYYPKFGFVVAAAHGLSCEYSAPVEAFMAIELQAGSFSRARGLVRYRPEFAAFS